MEAGVLENPHVDAFAAHVFAAIPYGTIGYGVEAMASVYGFKITLTGRGDTVLHRRAVLTRSTLV